MSSPSYLFTSESVTEGHPDKLCDQVSDAVLDALMAKDPECRVACETAVTTGLVVVMGEVTTNTYVDIPEIVRETIRNIGYTDAAYGIDFHTCGVMVSVKEQSQDISSAVGTSLEARDATSVADETEALGAGDQGMMVGFACTETPELMPLPISLSHALCKRLSTVRREGLLSYLRPDGKSQVTIEYARGVPKRIHTVVLSAQHGPEVSLAQLQRDLREHVVNPILPKKLIDDETKYFVNPSGKFELGGPHADTGLTGRKILVDTYGGAARHGGGAFSGKDPTKVDRSGAYAARYVAKNVVAAGLAERVEVQVSYAIGVAKPISISVETFGTGLVSDEVITGLIDKHFDLRPAAIIEDMKLRRPIFSQTASFGHFGREDIDVPWERTDKAVILRSEAGIL
ncbi:MAG: methionine adenosyltransferase [SAR202 cluster bacterium Io17-Chloro-G3]|nr:MAG: methionine adenosyltransferase [SAR202 cluster bacterium Io17-Chloro-G3]